MIIEFGKAKDIIKEHNKSNLKQKCFWSTREVIINYIGENHNDNT